MSDYHKPQSQRFYIYSASRVETIPESIKKKFDAQRNQTHAERYQIIMYVKNNTCDQGSNRRWKP